MNTNEIHIEINSLMKKSDPVFLTTIDEEGFPLTRAMLNLRNPDLYPGLEPFMDGARELYFTTNTSLPKVAQIEHNPHACAYFCSPSEWRGLSIRGGIEVISDSAIKKKIWQDGWTLYYPGGIDDPEYTLIRLTPKLIKGYRQLQHYTCLPDELGR
jgi:general stress protein 26